MGGPPADASRPAGTGVGGFAAGPAPPSFHPPPRDHFPQQATRQARRIYVGNLPHTASQSTIGEFFARALQTIGGAKDLAGPPVLNVYVNHEKRFSFVEFRSVEETSNAMALDGVLFAGVNIRVRRPNDYNAAMAASMGPSRPDPGLQLHLVGLQAGSGSVSDSPDRIFVGGLPYYLTEEQVRELLEQFGQIRSFDLVKDKETGNSKGYGFVLYADVSVTDTACQGLNGLRMGDKTLTARRAQQGAQAIQQQQQQQRQQQMMMMMAAPPMGGGHAMGGQPPPMRPPMDAAASKLQQQACAAIQSAANPTKFLRLSNVECGDDADEDIVEDMQEEGGAECERVHLDRPKREVRIAFATMEAARTAFKRMNGRRYAGNVVCCEFVASI